MDIKILTNVRSILDTLSYLERTKKISSSEAKEILEAVETSLSTGKDFFSTKVLEMENKTISKTFAGMIFR